VRPHLESGQSKIGRLLETAGGDEDPQRRAFVVGRVKQLEYWIKKGRVVLPVLQKVLGE
jgi:hypothetical protein